MSQSMHCRPSSLMGVMDPLVAFYADRATWTFAMTIESEIEAAVTRLPKTAKESAHAKARQRVIDQYLGIDQANAPQRFRSPSSTR